MQSISNLSQNYETFQKKANFEIFYLNLGCRHRVIYRNI